jgi:hypothetical protein
MTIHKRWLAGLVAIPLAVSATRPVPAAAAAELPGAVRAQLSAAFPGWRFARLLPALRHELESDGPRRSAEWVAGDFDDDRRGDYAVQIVRAGPLPADSAQLVVVFLGRDHVRYAVSIVWAGGEHLGQILTTAKRGERVKDFDKGAMGDSTFVLKHDAVVVLINEGAAITCLYETDRWRCVQSAD